MSTETRDVEEIEVALLLEAIVRRYGFDFREYAPASLKRRVWRRAHAEGLETISALQDRVLHDPSCMERLLLDLSINVTTMFRDPSFYTAFRAKVGARLTRRRKPPPVETPAIDPTKVGVSA